eukprot:9355733-Alexandrium_andersonii.AAC.1
MAARLGKPSAAQDRELLAGNCCRGPCRSASSHRHQRRGPGQVLATVPCAQELGTATQPAHRWKASGPSGLRLCSKPTSRPAAPGRMALICLDHNAPRRL